MRGGACSEREERKLDIPVMAGGAAVTEKFAQSIGAHYSRDAVTAVKTAAAILSK